MRKVYMAAHSNTKWIVCDDYKKERKVLSTYYILNEFQIIYLYNLLACPSVSGIVSSCEIWNWFDYLNYV